eukprot:577669-Amphidinium_carterae.1
MTYEAGVREVTILGFGQVSDLCTAGTDDLGMVIIYSILVSENLLGKRNATKSFLRITMPATFMLHAIGLSNGGVPQQVGRIFKIITDDDSNDAGNGRATTTTRRKVLKKLKTSAKRAGKIA